MPNRLTGTVGIVTGGGRGIGRAIAEAYAAEGMRVVVTAAREAAEIDAVASRIGGLALVADVTKEDDAARVVDETRRRFGRIDVLVNNAARGMRYVNEEFLTRPEPFWLTSEAAWRLVLDTNIMGVFLMTRAVVPVMLAQPSGRIINLSINHETMRRPGFSPYGPSKAALESMNAIWAQELAGTGVTVNLLLPGGATATGMIPDSFPVERRGTLLDPGIVAEPAIYLASAASAAVTGARLVATEWPGEDAFAAMGRDT